MSSFSKNPLIRALQIISQWLDAEKIPYMVFGGVANSIYGDARQTFDVDIKLHIGAEDDIDSFLESIVAVARLLPDDPRAFVSETQVLPVVVDGVRVDLVFANLPFEIEAIKRSVEKLVFGIKIHVCTPEDLIVQKAISTRPKDWMDIENLIRRKKTELDWPYLEKNCSELAHFLDRPELLKRILELKSA